jgi:hypothetical protein
VATAVAFLPQKSDVSVANRDELLVGFEAIIPWDLVDVGLAMRRARLWAVDR